MGITELRYRPDALKGRPFSATLSQAFITLSTMAPRAGGLSGEFGWNTGPDATVVYAGPLSISSAVTGPALGPKDFDIVVPLQRPFHYDGAKGDLLVNMWIDSPTAGGTRVSAQDSRIDGCSRMVGGWDDKGGVIDSTVDALQITAFPANEKPPLQFVTPGSGFLLAPWRYWLAQELAQSDIFSRGETHYQNVYAASFFPTYPLLIRELRLQTYGYLGSAIQDPGVDLLIRMSTIPRAPDELAKSFQENFGSNTRPVFTGRLPFPVASGDGPPGSELFNLAIPLDCPYLYDPQQGGLLIDITTLSTFYGAPKVLTVISTQDEASSVVASTASLTGTPSSETLLVHLIVSTAENTTGQCAQTPVEGATLTRVPTNPSKVGPRIDAAAFSTSRFRSQHLYPPTVFPTQPMRIHELRWRLASIPPRGLQTVIGPLHIRLSVTRRPANLMSSRFSENVGEGETLVFSGPFEVDIPPSAPLAEGGYEVRFPLLTPFDFDPGQGALLVDVIHQGTSTVGPALAMTNSLPGSRSLSGSLSNSAGILSSAVGATDFLHTPLAHPRKSLPRFLRGPFLQSVGSDQVTLCWIADAFDTGSVRYGLTPETLVQTSSDSIMTNRHNLTITGLSPGTRYYYAIGSDPGLSLSGPDYFFETSPIGATPTRIWAIGDAGTGYWGPAVGGMRDAYKTYSRGRHTDVWLMLGDNAYYTGTEEEYDLNVFRVFGDMLRNTPVWPTLGNHEVYSQDAAGNIPYLSIFHLPTQGEGGGLPSGSERYYSFDHANIHFVCLDSETSSLDATSLMLRWLKADLDSNTNEWLIAFWHSPPYSKGRHDSDFESPLIKMREKVLPILESYGVDLVLCGHSHSYERSFLMDRHYGLSGSLKPATMILDDGDGRPDGDGSYTKPGGGPSSPHSGAVYVVAGNGAHLESGSFDHPAMFYSAEVIGSVVIDVIGPRLDLRFLTINGAIDDQFTLLKGPNPGPLSITKARLGPDFISLTWSTEAGQWYQVEGAETLSSSWQAVSDPIQSKAAEASWTQSNPAWKAAQFYRVVLLHR